MVGIPTDPQSSPICRPKVCFTLGFLSEMIAKMVVQGFLTYLRALVVRHHNGHRWCGWRSEEINGTGWVVDWSSLMLGLLVSGDIWRYLEIGQMILTGLTGHSLATCGHHLEKTFLIGCSHENFLGSDTAFAEHKAMFELRISCRPWESEIILRSFLDHLSLWVQLQQFQLQLPLDIPGPEVMWIVSVDQASDAFALARVVRRWRRSDIGWPVSHHVSPLCWFNLNFIVMTCYDLVKSYNIHYMISVISVYII